LGDAEQDEGFTCEGLANAIRRCRVDFGAEIDIDLADITERKENLSHGHFALGRIRYKGEKKPSGVLLYFKSSLTGDEPVDVLEYAGKNKAFPHQTTGDQFFDEQQFESYRKLGLHVAEKALGDKTLVTETPLGNWLEKTVWNRKRHRLILRIHQSAFSAPSRIILFIRKMDKPLVQRKHTHRKPSIRNQNPDYANQRLSKLHWRGYKKRLGQ
jgi:hypothetical protein